MSLSSQVFSFVVLPIAAGIYFLISRKYGSYLLAALIAAVPLAAGIALWSATYAVASSPIYDWNAGKIAPVVAMLRGQPRYALYQDPTSGVMTGWIYGPVAAVPFVAASIWDRPTDVIITGALINALCVLIPALWLHIRLARSSKRTAATWIALLTFCLFLWICLWQESLRRATFMVTPDAPALGLAACSCAVLMRAKGGLSLRRSIIVAALAVLAMWAKQTTLPLLLLAPIHLALKCGRREAVRYTIILMVVGIAFSAAIIAACGFGNMWFQMVTVPASHPWRELQVPKTLVLAHAVGALIFDSLPSLVPLVILAIAIASMRHHPERWLAASGAFIESGWYLLPLSAALLAPGALLGYVKLGGNINNFALSGWFLTIAATSAAAIVIARIPSAKISSGILVGVCVLLLAFAAQVAIVRRQLIPMASRIGNPYDNDQETAYAFAKDHPGVAYFPWNNLSTLLAEGKLYHFEWGFWDRFTANRDPSPEQIRKHIPHNVELVAFPVAAQSEFSLRMFTHPVAVAPISALRGFVIYRVR